jgi:hypothetical protein
MNIGIQRYSECLQLPNFIHSITDSSRHFYFNEVQKNSLFVACNRTITP